MTRGEGIILVMSSSHFKLTHTTAILSFRCHYLILLASRFILPYIPSLCSYTSACWLFLLLFEAFDVRDLSCIFRNANSTRGGTLESVARRKRCSEEVFSLANDWLSEERNLKCVGPILWTPTAAPRLKLTDKQTSESVDKKASSRLMDR